MELRIDDLLQTGQGVGRASGIAVFVWGPIPGERVRARITAVKGTYAVAETAELLETSSQRATPFCPVFGTCGGCQVQHLAYEAQLTWKRRLVVDALERIAGLHDIVVHTAVGMDDPRAYRNKMALVVEESRDGVGFGFYRARSHELVRIEHCPIVDPALDRLIGALWVLGRSHSARPVFAGVLHVVARVSDTTKEIVASFTTRRRSTALARAGATVMHALPGVIGLENSYAPASENAIMGSQSAALSGRAELEEQIGGVRFRFSAGSFFQVNTEIVARIFETLQPRLHENLRIVDLYCGAGTFAVFFARHGCQVVGVESSGRAVKEARATAERNGVAATTTFFVGPVERVLGEADGARVLGDAHVAFLDPPRKGTDAATLQRIAAARVEHVWYLSCNPATLARDLAILERSGYRTVEVQPFDMFPQTGHVEALAFLRRRNEAVWPPPTSISATSPNSPESH